MAMNAHTRCVYEELHRIGIVHPAWTIQFARDLSIPISLAAAILLQESGGGHNIFGHDPFLRPTRTLNWLKGRKVTRARYAYYKRMRKRGHGMQGVGPLQLTWYTFQDYADRIGGAYKPFINMKVGFTDLARMLAAGNGEHAGVAQYNGGGVQADHYADQVIARKEAIHLQLAHCR